MPDHHDPHRELAHDWGHYALYELLSQRFDKLETTIQNAMATYTEAINAYKTKQDAHNTKIDASIANLIADNEAQTALILKLQTSPGPISAEDQASLDELDARTSAVADKLEALDALNPPVVPTGTGTGTATGPGA